MIDNGPHFSPWDVLSLGRFVPETFCPLGRFVLGKFCLGTFCMCIADSSSSAQTEGRGVKSPGPTVHGQ